MPELKPQEQFHNIINKYLENVTNISDGAPELEIRFGTRGKKAISKIDFDNVIKKLKSSGFIMGPNQNTLKIQTSFTDSKTGQLKDSNVRVEINGVYDIQKYCNTNSMNDIMAIYNQKSYAKIGDSNIYPVNMDDYNFRVSFQKEKIIGSSSAFVNNIKSSWNDNKKIFRLLNRVSFEHPKYPIRIDMSVVKENHSEKTEYKGRPQFKLKSEYTFQAAKVTDNNEKYEIELEIINSKVGIGTEYNDADKLEKMIKKCIINILSGIQGTNFPVSYNEIQEIGNQYLKLTYGKDYNDRLRLFPKSFIGPSSTTLQIKNITPVNEDAQFPNIRDNYTVTDKADGMRKLLYINKSGKIYLIDTNMNIQFTGAVTKKIELMETILDGEHILHNKKGEFINLYAAFDVYIINKKDVRNNPFIPNEDDSTERGDVLNKFRLPLLVNIITNLDAVSITSAGLPSIRIAHKNFMATNKNQTIFQCCNTILESEISMEYTIDGLIFTPAYLGVGANSIGESGPKFKKTWNYSFKWKPPHFNTIDFLVQTKKTVNDNDFVGNIFQDGTDTTSSEQLSQYKTLILKVGFDESKDGYLNPCADVINDNIPRFNDTDTKKDNYKPVAFYPSNPEDSEASVCNVMLKYDNKNEKQLFTTEDEDVFSDGMIVEFSYDITKDHDWRWIPLRVRYDKTEEYRKGFHMYGNAYAVANSNWHSIHHPITEEMIKYGTNIPDEISDDTVYYNRNSGKSETVALRNFHTLFVKQLLIDSISTKGDTLIDYAVGSGGDINRWRVAKLAFIFGIDVSKDNIENRITGACARYLNDKKKYKGMPSALFVEGNTQFNIKDGEALRNERGKQITMAVFGEGPKDKDKLGLGVYNKYGIASNGFNISSCQFALHYFFQDKKTLNGFLRNVSECTKIGGYFIGGCYNGSRIFNALNTLKLGESTSIILENGTKIWEITKQYDKDEFNADETSLGYEIDVYQETINKKFIEYLVNFEYLNRMMENYGFTLLTQDECDNIGIPESVGPFETLFNLMVQKVKKNPNKKKDYGIALNMKEYEKKISFFNNYFFYKKLRNVDTRTVYNNMIGSSKLQQQLEKLDSDTAQSIIQEEKTEIAKSYIAPKKIKRKLKLKEVSK